MDRTATEEAVYPVNVENRTAPKVYSLLGRWTEAWRQRLISLMLVASDGLLALVAWNMAFMMQDLWGRGPLSEATIIGVAPSVAVWIAIRALLGMYPGYGLDAAEELRRQTYALTGTLAITMIFAFVTQFGHLMSRLALFLGFVGLLVFAPLARQLVKYLMMKAGLWGKPVVVFGSGEFGGRVAKLLSEEWELGYKPVAVFDSQPTSRKNKYEQMPDERSLAGAETLARSHGVDTAILAMPHIRRKCLVEVVGWASYIFRHVMVIPNLEGITNSMVVARNFAGVFGVEIRHNLLNPSVRRVKRALDVLATVLGGALILPFLVVLALLVWLESGRPIFYSAKRLGRDDELFACFKFRTMVPDAEANLQRMLDNDPKLKEEYSRYHKLREDPRITRVGGFLRATSLDELPQLWNVLCGQMSLVGPRPYLPRESAKIGAVQSEILRVYPGITGPWQISGRNDMSFLDRVRIDSDYVRNWCIWLDLVILVRTLWALVRRRGL